MRRRTRWAVGGALLLSAGLALGAYQLMNARTVQLAGDLVHRVDTDERVVALTFDDGPTPRTEEILAVLAEHGARATFYVTGAELAEQPDAGAAIVAAGHELGNHSWSHPRMVLLGRDRIAEEVEATDAQIRAAGQQGEITFRPPYGKKLLGLPRYLAATDRLTVTWDVAPEDDAAVAADPDAIVAHVLEEVAPGSIVLLHLMHEANAPSRAALPRVIEALRADGYELVTVRELLERR
jgi:peptidoglycan-N-acetylglucosamine deacetylase